MTAVREDAAGGGWRGLGVLILAVVVGLPINNAVDYAVLLVVVLSVVCGSVRTHPCAWVEALGLVIFVVVTRQLLSPPRIVGAQRFLPGTERGKRRRPTFTARCLPGLTRNIRSRDAAARSSPAAGSRAVSEQFIVNPLCRRLASWLARLQKASA